MPLSTLCIIGFPILDSDLFWFNNQVVIAL